MTSGIKEGNSARSTQQDGQEACAICNRSFDMEHTMAGACAGHWISGARKKKEKYMLAKRPRALRKGFLTSKLARVSPKGPPT
eukprot:1156712-Pelagomonas_calceolata.AAC.5